MSESLATPPTTPSTSNSGDGTPVGQPVAAAPSGSASPTPSAAGAASAGDWVSQFKNDEVKSYVQAKGFKDAEVLADSYRNLEKLMGAPKDQLLRLPTEEGSPEWNQVFERLGKPKDPNGYKIEAAKDVPGAGEFAQWAKENFHKANLTESQAKTLYEAYNGFAKGELTKQEAAFAAAQKAEFETLKAEWGNAYEQNINIAKQGAKQFGVDEAKLNAMQKVMGYKETIKFFQNIGSKLGEASFVEGISGGAGRSSPEVARAQISQLLADPAFSKAYANGGAKEKAQMNNLFKDAYPGETTI